MLSTVLIAVWQRVHEAVLVVLHRYHWPTTNHCSPFGSRASYNVSRGAAPTTTRSDDTMPVQSTSSVHKLQVQ